MDIFAIIDKVSEILDIHVHHFDHMKRPNGYLKPIDGSPIVVAYGAKYSPWCFAIMDDFSIVIPTIDLLKTIEAISNRLEKLTDAPQMEILDQLNILSNIRFAEEFLKNSPDSKIITDFKSDKLTYYYE